ncbi:hypothetical protein [Cryobacterium sp. 10I5]|uniref:hypothetical protein n=1 Tax=Cryobacterium sp. 10I5 TaxID=3048581 RepID=UPI002B22600C|nr:hypothetical protein [Cryobacterium sp. 10I5]MEB0264368.1 hypothetical protein [Cryobacterium sp. 10I5]
MSWDICTIICLYVVSFLLPIFGLWGLYQTAVSDANRYKSAPGTGVDEEVSIGKFNVMVESLQRTTLDRPKAARRDFFFIGLGVFLGSFASIWSVIKPFLS